MRIQKAFETIALCTAWLGLHWQGSLRPTLTYFLSDRVRVISLITSVSAALYCQRKIGENHFTIAQNQDITD
jgi:hypothetical protein